MNITLIANTYHPKMGGAENHIRTLAKHLKDKGLNVNILTRNIPDLSHNVEGTPVHGFPSMFGVYHSYVIHSVPLFDPALVLSPLVKRDLFKDSIIHAHGHIAISLVPPKKLLRYPLVLTVHDYWPVCFHTGLVLPNKELCNLHNDCNECLSFYMGKLSYVAQKMAKVTSMLLTNVDKFVAVSSYVKSMLVQGGIPSDKIAVIHNWVNDNKVRWDTEHVPEKTKSALYVGKLTKYKGTDVMIDAVSRIVQDIPDFQLRIVGSGPLKGVCEEKVRKMKLTKNIHFLGHVDEKTLYQEYRNAMLFVCPSTWPEPCATVLLEAMSFKLPIVGSNVGGIPELVQDMKNGLLFQPGDPDSLAKCVLKLINDDHLCRVYGERGRKLVEEKFSIEVQIPKLMKVYQSVA